MSLRAYMNSGHEGVPDVKILVCVSSIGARKTVKSRPKSVKEQSTDLSLIEVDVFDETANCALKLWEDKVSSARTWIPNRTVLLISNPYYRQPDKRGTSSGLGIGITSMVDVDPDFPDAHWLRREAVNRTKKESVYIPFPDGLWDAEIAIHGPDRTLFTLADVDDFARDDPAHIFTGKLNLIILGVRIIENWRRNMLCCFECCGVPLYANRLHGMCKNCQTEQSLHLNPRIIGSLADETGTVALGKLIWSDRAWTELFFGTGNYSRASTSADHVDLTAGDAQEAVGFSWQELVALDVNRLRSVEEQLEFSRVTLTFGWSPELGRLCVLGVEW
ncbi:hypothetical protein B0H67DRAFT_643026 [Lasiosphaeris hirsuta]|uniref:Uncharacterized protein n=1 Tax=Lasiosphaeris hirsuta TaxID=260670 RepID=A0AA40DX80_9PEZI|nr:hypothetical protein B0H67DRAFT_643026 [Lasiosphaeris hirsuta]